MINIHTHIFRQEDSPDAFPSKALKSLSNTKVGMAILKTILHNANPFLSSDSLDKMLQMIKAGQLGSQKAIFEHMAENYPLDTIFVVLPMDMAYMGAGKCRPYHLQLKELEELRCIDNRVLPFLMVDHRNPNMRLLFEQYVYGCNWGGAKFYPPLGTFPQAEEYDYIYQRLVELDKPLIAHCTYSNAVHFKGKEKELAVLLGDKYDKKATRKENCDKFTDPMNWGVVAEKYPNLRIDIAHFGGANMWDMWYKNPKDRTNLVNIIRDLMYKYPNIYSDISFTLSDRKTIPLLNMFLNDDKIKHKILFGSDYYMSLSECSEIEWSINLRHEVGETNWNQMQQNNRKFLGL